MTILDRNEIWAQAHELGQLILESPEVIRFKEAEQTMEHHPVLSSKIRKFRDLQDEYDKLSEYSTGSHLDGLRNDIRTLSQELDTYPEVQAYKAAMSEVDDLLQAVTQLVASAISEKSQG
jgi:cell fate (sporulation/competence/biofilm development) regulator YlbF (YheA/YmcA/DUF963 family)